MKDDLDTLSDAQLDLLFKKEVAQWTEHEGAPFCANASFVLPFLDRHYGTHHQSQSDPAKPREWICTIYTPTVRQGIAATFARAAVLALIRAARAQALTTAHGN